MNIPVFDLHCDTAYTLLNNGCKETYGLKSNHFHVDLQKAAGFAGYAQCFACFTSPDDPLCKRLSPEAVFEMEYSSILKQLEQNKDCIRLAGTTADIENNCSQHLMSAILTLEGTAGIGYDHGRLQELYTKGFRITTLGWNEDNCLTGSHATGGGLTSLGKEFVRTAQNVGFIIDASHVSDQAFWDIMDITKGCVIASHSNSRAVHPVTRNLTDDMFLAICRTGGVAGINLYTEFLGVSATLDTVCDHILHYLDLDPEGKHIALGGDLDGCESLPSGFDDLSSYTVLADRMIYRGISQETIMDIFWNNAMGVFESCCMSAQEIK